MMQLQRLMAEVNPAEAGIFSRSGHDGTESWQWTSSVAGGR